MIHAAVVQENYAEKLVGHASIDSTAIIGREKSCRKNTPNPKMKKKRGRKSKAEITAMAEQKIAEIKTRRLELQPNRTLPDDLDDLPQGGAIGAENATAKEKYPIGADINYICLLRMEAYHWRPF